MEGVGGEAGGEAVAEDENQLGEWLSEQGLPASLVDAAGVATVEQLAGLSNAEIDSLASGAGLKKVVAMRLKRRLDSHRFAARSAARKQAAGAAELTARALVGDGNTLAAARAMVLSPRPSSDAPEVEAQQADMDQLESLDPSEPSQPVESLSSPLPQGQLARSPRAPGRTKQSTAVSVSSFSTAHPFEPEPEPEPEPELQWRLEPVDTLQQKTQVMPEAVPPQTLGAAAQQTFDDLRDRIQHLERAAPLSVTSPVSQNTPSSSGGVGPRAEVESEATVLCDEMGLMRQRAGQAGKAGKQLATQATRLEPRLRQFASRALQLHAHATDLYTDNEDKARRLQSAHEKNLEMERAHREHRIHSESLEQLAEQKHAAEVRAMQVQVEEAKAALAEESSARAKEWAEATAMEEELTAKLAQRTEQLRRLQREFDMAGEQVERDFETQSARLTETETNLAETEAALAELGEEKTRLQERLLQSEEQQMALENDHRSTVEAMQRQMESQAKALEHLRTDDGRAESAEGSLKQLEGLNDELLAALVEVRAENEALSHHEIVKQMDEVQRINHQLNEALEAKNAQVMEVQKENARLEALNAKLVHVHATAEHVEQAVETRQLLSDHEKLQASYTEVLQQRQSHTAEHQELQDKFTALQVEKDVLENYAHELATLAETFIHEGATNTSAAIAAAPHPAAHFASSSAPLLLNQPTSFQQQQQQQQQQQRQQQQQPASSQGQIGHASAQHQPLPSPSRSPLPPQPQPQPQYQQPQPQPHLQQQLQQYWK